MFEVSWLKAEHFLFVKSVWNMKMISGATSIILHLDGGVLIVVIPVNSLLKQSYHSLLLLCLDNFAFCAISCEASEKDESNQNGDAEGC